LAVHHEALCLDLPSERDHSLNLAFDEIRHRVEWLNTASCAAYWVSPAATDTSKINSSCLELSVALISREKLKLDSIMTSKTLEWWIRKAAFHALLSLGVGQPADWKDDSALADPRAFISSCASLRSSFSPATLTPNPIILLWQGVHWFLSNPRVPNGEQFLIQVISFQ